MSAQKPSWKGMLGAEASATWLAALGLEPVPRWYAEVALADGESRFFLNVYAEEWGYAFHHGSRASWIRVTDIAFVHGRDDYSLLTTAPDLLAIETVIRRVETDHSLAFPRGESEIRTNLAAGAEHAIRSWLVDPQVPRRTREL
jgi:hypothetical protein